MLTVTQLVTPRGLDGALLDRQRLPIPFKPDMMC